MKHTPGPWKVGFEDGSGPTYITDSNDQSVVSGATDDWGVIQGVLKPEDARLIAAAPELLEACEVVAKELRDHVDGYDMVDSSLEECHKILREVIARAQ